VGHALTAENTAGILDPLISGNAYRCVGTGSYHIPYVTGLYLFTFSHTAVAADTLVFISDKRKGLIPFIFRKARPVTFLVTYRIDGRQPLQFTVVVSLA